ncbi:hypothetical protein GCM10027445_43750 [Amycolatopsis endophytica]|uniref:Uncharacterized protein n=1 Tax=Amycolatopsis endophytica TaxID=860233 RepID=A0A853BD19_9PSEU|nr:hypothetical protein [Amycolatopsis endophytica]NYI93263.1 hypothetical protein [Amycolatopsis endophytica]
MSTRIGPPLPPEERALDDVAWGQGLRPSRIFSVLLPVWQVEVRATVTDGRPYHVIDRFLERGIAEGGLSSVPELARFFALDEPLVDRAVRFLARIGHVAVRDGGLVLTGLGLESQRDGVCYVVSREDRRKMYFDAFTSRPFGRAYYDTGSVTFLTAEKVGAITAARSYPRFLQLISVHGFRREALGELAGRADRDRYNLPFRIEQPESLGEEIVYLPLHLVRAADARGGTRYLAYGQVSRSADPELSDLCQSVPEIVGLLESETLSIQPGRHEQRITEWLDGKGLHGIRPVETERGAWRVTLPPSAFQPAGRVSPARIGSFVPLATGLLAVWCEDERTREEAFLSRVDSVLTAHGRDPRHDPGPTIERIGRQLHLSARTAEQARELALHLGRNPLAARLTELIAKG